MPNLRSHILLAEQIYKRIESAQLREILEKQSALYCLGAVVPDIFLYNILWWELPHLDDILHDYPKPRSVAMIRHMLNELKASSPLDPEKTAFILGLMTHILAENIFHPAIFYFSGNYYDHDHNERHLAVSSHRHLETLLDNVRSAWNVGAIFRTADGLGVEKLHLCGITPTPGNPSVAKTALGADKTIPWTASRNALTTALALQSAGARLWALEQDERAIPLTDFGLQSLPTLQGMTDGQLQRQETLESAGHYFL